MEALEYTFMMQIFCFIKILANFNLVVTRRTQRLLNYVIVQYYVHTHMSAKILADFKFGGVRTPVISVKHTGGTRVYDSFRISREGGRPRLATLYNR